ncbi:MAG: TIGR02302 family protein [Pseudomonadota bacterium]
MSETEPTVHRETPANLPKKARQALWRARLHIGVERLIRAITPAFSTAVLIVALALLGLWQVLPATLGWLALGAAGIAFFLSFIPFRSFRWPTRFEAADRVETATGLNLREMQTLDDDLAVGSGDASAERLWVIHRDRAAKAAEQAKAGKIQPGLAAYDTRGLRAIPILLFIIGVFVAGDDWRDRLSGPQAIAAGPTEIVSVRIDAWVSPPVYTGEPPIVLTQDQIGDAEIDVAESLRVPENSVFAVRVTPADGVTFERSGATGPVTVEDAEDNLAAAEFGKTLTEPERFILKKNGEILREWSFNILNDEAPNISFVEEPSQAFSGALQLSYSLSDDYGVVSARAVIEPESEAGGAEGAEPLFEAPDVPLVLPEARVREGEGQTTRDLMAHPWAGSTVKLRLEALDDAAQIGTSDVVSMTLPQREFRNPLARALVDERRILALDAREQLRVSNALEALSIAPDEFTPNTTHYLLLRSAYWRLQAAEGNEALREFVDYLWNIALAIEDGNLSLAEQRLRDAQQALMDALENGASDQEIEQLMAELRDAMRDFMQELARNADQMPPTADQQPMDPSQMLSSQDLEQMLDQIEEMARSGARDAARQMLSQLQNMMENLRNAQRMPQQPQGQSEMSEALQELQEMIRRQQELMDQTFQMQQGQGQQGQEQQMQPGEGQQPGQMGQNGQGNFQDQLDQLGQGQQSLREALENLMNQLGQMGMEPGQNLGQAGDSMQGAEGNLRGGEPGSALDDQAQALDQLRQGAQDMTQQMMQAFGNQGESNGEQRDPLGRPQRTEGPDLGNTVKVPDEIDMQRAREILNELRERLSNPQRPQIERDYLERLIRPY